MRGHKHISNGAQSQSKKIHVTISEPHLLMENSGCDTWWRSFRQPSSQPDRHRFLPISSFFPLQSVRFVGVWRPFADRRQGWILLSTFRAVETLMLVPWVGQEKYPLQMKLRKRYITSVEYWCHYWWKAALAVAPAIHAKQLLSPHWLLPNLHIGYN